MEWECYQHNMRSSDLPNTVFLSYAHTCFRFPTIVLLMHCVGILYNQGFISLFRNPCIQCRALLSIPPILILHLNGCTYEIFVVNTYIGNFVVFT